MNRGPLFSYFGSKWRLARRYPRPRYPLIIEPFAGSAGYSLRYWERDVHLVDSFPTVANLWRYLIGATPEQITALPDDFDLDEQGLIEEERALMGFWAGKARAYPADRRTPWADRHPDRALWWGPRVKARLVHEVTRIKHWRATCGDYRQLPMVEATWFIDPPYQFHGQCYAHGSRKLDYDELREWVLRLPGQVLVCEGEGADWLPFRPIRLGSRPVGMMQPWVKQRGPVELFWYRDTHRRGGTHTDTVPTLEAQPVRSIWYVREALGYNAGMVMTTAEEETMPNTTTAIERARKRYQKKNGGSALTLWHDDGPPAPEKLSRSERIQYVMRGQPMSIDELVVAMKSAHLIPRGQTNPRKYVSTAIAQCKQPLTHNGVVLKGKGGLSIKVPAFIRISRGVYRAAAPGEVEQPTAEILKLTKQADALAARPHREPIPLEATPASYIDPSDLPPASAVRPIVRQYLKEILRSELTGALQEILSE